jgi:hypothetical protein
MDRQEAWNRGLARRIGMVGFGQTPVRALDLGGGRARLQAEGLVRVDRHSASVS